MAIWVNGWIRCGFGGAEGWWQQQTWPFLPDHDICDWEHSWVDLSAAYSAKCQLTKFLASLEELSGATFLSHLGKGRLAHPRAKWANHNQAWKDLTDHLSCMGKERNKDNIQGMWAWAGWNVSLAQRVPPQTARTFEECWRADDQRYCTSPNVVAVFNQRVSA